ncbi:hypothetical protein [Rhodococcoides fascians]|uniref:hypothetical protein n=1 Tax=Rhodococcoides fascians TaxID=1828 RepID=UPI001F4D2867|nr:MULTISPECIES: hypothetical protein [Rhodococcus]
MRVLVHSITAAVDVKADIPNAQPVVVRHPIDADAKDDEAPVPGGRVVRVFGQFKRDRDVSALIEIAQQLPGNLIFEIHGRGWPEIEGWDVKSAYLSEDELDSLIRSSAVVVVPYKRFYQSGIAVRCVELGVPFVGPSVGSLIDLVGEGSELLVKSNEWCSAVAEALKYDRSAMSEVLSRYAMATKSDWNEWHRTATGLPSTGKSRGLLLEVGKC